MATLYINRVNHGIYKDIYFKDLKEEEKDKVFYIKYGPTKQIENKNKNYKRFIIEQPRIRLQLTDYLYNLIVEEMFFEKFHDIRYKKVDNKGFYKRLKEKQCQSFRFYLDNKWITYYFNLKSKSKVMQSDFPCALAIYSSYPAKGLHNFLKQPCTFEGGQNVKCFASDWGIRSIIAGLKITKETNSENGINIDGPVKEKFDYNINNYNLEDAQLEANNIIKSEID